MPKIIATDEDWLKLGLKYFSTGGVKALNVEKMATRLRCSKSSFYWYFDNRDVFINKMLNYWVRVGTDALVAEAENNQTPSRQLYSLLQQVFTDRRGQDFMFYLRKFAQTNAAAKLILDETERARTAYVAALLVQIGLEARVAQEKAEMIYAYYLGWYEQHKYQQFNVEAESERQIRLLVDHLQLPIKTEGLE
jgi:AcrR family transcriptional regulator